MTLHLILILVHVLAELNRQAGHADIVRELLDGQVGWRRPGDNVLEADEAWWAAYREGLEHTTPRARSPDLGIDDALQRQRRPQI